MYWNITIDGSHSIKLWVNDTANNWGVSSTVSFTVDTTLPSASIQLPLNATYNKLNGSVTLNFTTSDNLGVSQCKYELDGVNTSLPTCSNTTLSLTDGNHTIKVWVNDTANNWNSTSLTYFISDFTSPAVTIQSPTNSTYTSNYFSINYTASDTLSLATCKYELDGVNTTISNCQNTSRTITEGQGNHTIKIWAIDTAGNTNVTSLTSFSMDLLIYATAYDEATGTQLTFNLTLNNISNIKNYLNQLNYIGNYTGDPRGTNVQAVFSLGGYNSRTQYYTWYGTQRVNITAYLTQSTSTYPYNLIVKNSLQAPITGAIVSVYKQIGGAWTLVAQGTTDSSGTTTQYLIPLSNYQVIILASGYNPFTVIITPTLTEFTYNFLIGDLSTINFATVLSNILISLMPTTNSLAGNGSINWTVYSSTSSLEWYSLNLSNGFFLNITTNFGGMIQGNYTNFNSGNITATAQFKKSGYDVYTVTRVYYWQNNTIGNATLLALFNNITGDTSIGVQGKAFMALAATAGAVFIGGAAAGPVGSGLLGVGALAGSYYFDWIDTSTVVLTILFFFAVAIITSREVW